jgi:integrase
LLHSNYTPYWETSHDNALVKALLVFDFGYGVRCPSEAWVLKRADFHPEKHLIVVTEPKKSGRRRTLMIEPEWLCCSSRHPSLGTYLVWRRKVDPNDEQEAFFLRADGTPFPSKAALSKFVNDLVKPRFPWFHPYLGRHWSVNARLIDWGFDYARVADWHGHETVDMTRREYDHNARILARLHGRDWLSRAARIRNATVIDRTPKNAVSITPTGEK